MTKTTIGVLAALALLLAVSLAAALGLSHGQRLMEERIKALELAQDVGQEQEMKR